VQYEYEKCNGSRAKQKLDVTEKEKCSLGVMVRFKRFGIVGCLIRMSMRNDGTIGQDMAVQENNLVDDQQPHQGYNQTGKYFFYLVMSGEIHHAAKIS
jgi:hypothetical protein